jgi:hypothetical protein
MGTEPTVTKEVSKLMKITQTTNKQPPWPKSARELTDLYRPPLVGEVSANFYGERGVA